MATSIKWQYQILYPAARSDIACPAVVLTKEDHLAYTNEYGFNPPD
jgi:hypothetical protein